MVNDWFPDSAALLTIYSTWLSILRRRAAPDLLFKLGSKSLASARSRLPLLFPKLR
jgi:hypothetical protein